jgi:hypothetical protein
MAKTIPDPTNMTTGAGARSQTMYGPLFLPAAHLS